MKERRVKEAVLLLRVGFGAMLIYASVSKLADPFAFSVAVRNYGVVGADLARVTAVLLPSLELVTGVLLLFGIWTGAAALLNALMMWGFLAMVTQAFIRGLDISCGCFHMDEGKISVGKLVFNLLLAFISLVLLRLIRIKEKG